MVWLKVSQKQVMAYAIVLISGKQVKVREGEIIEVAKIDVEKGKTLILDKVLLFSDGQKNIVGQPYVKDLQVEGEVIEQLKGKKLYVSKFKSKVRYRRKTGFRPHLSRIKITKIGSPGENKAVVKVTKKTMTKAKKVVKKVSKKASK